MSGIKYGILLKKAKRFFEQFPDRSSTILKMKVGNVDTHWNVQHKDNQFNITEINSSKNSFVIKEDDTAVGGKSKKPFLYNPQQKPTTPPPQRAGTGTVAPGSEPVAKGTPWSIQQAADAIRSGPAAKKFQGQTPPPLPSQQQQLAKKIEKMSPGKNAYDRDTIKKAAQTLSDKEFGQFYGISKKSLVKQASTPPPLPSKVKAAGAVPYNPKPVLGKTAWAASRAKLRKKQGLTTGRTFTGKVIKEASPAFSKISAAFMDYMAKQGDHVAQSNFINTISREKMGLVNKQEKDSVAAIESQYLGQATQAADASTKQTPLAGKQQTSPVQGPAQQHKWNSPAKPNLNAGLERKYRVMLSEDDSVKGLDSQPTVDHAEDDSAEQQPVQTPAKQQTSEEKAVGKLSGQMIKQASVEFDQGVGTLSLQLAGIAAPATLEWSKDGKAVFTFKGARYTLRK